MTLIGMHELHVYISIYVWYVCIYMYVWYVCIYIYVCMVRTYIYVCMVRMYIYVCMVRTSPPGPTLCSNVTGLMTLFNNSNMAERMAPSAAYSHSFYARLMKLRKGKLDSQTCLVHGNTTF